MYGCNHYIFLQISYRFCEIIHVCCIFEGNSGSIESHEPSLDLPQSLAHIQIVCKSDDAFC